VGFVELTVMLWLDGDGVESGVDGIGASGLEAVVMLVPKEELVACADVVVNAEDFEGFVGDRDGVTRVVDRAGTSRTCPDGRGNSAAIGETES
jgi:hypothetical protein